MYVVLTRWNSKLRDPQRVEHVEWATLGQLWTSEEAAVGYIKVISRKMRHSQYKVMKVSDLNPIKIYEYESAEGSSPIQVVEVERSPVTG